MRGDELPTILFVAALQEEIDALWQLPGELLRSDRLSDCRGTWVRQATLPSCHIVSAACGEMGQILTALTVTKLALTFRPTLVVMIGICGGIRQRGCNLGDLVMSTRCVQYRIGRFTSKLKPSTSRVDAHRALQPLISDYASACRLERIAPDAIRKLKAYSTPVCRHGPFGSADLVVKDTEIIRLALGVDPNIVALDMESFAAMHAADYCGVPYGALVIKSVSDHADANKSKIGRDAVKAISAAAALDFVLRGFVPHVRNVRGSRADLRTAWPFLPAKRPVMILASVDAFAASRADKSGKKGTVKYNGREVPIIQKKIGSITAYIAEHPKRIVEATTLATFLLMVVDPECILLCGPCGGIAGRTSIGDLIIATRCFHFQFGGYKDRRLEPEIRAVDINDHLRSLLMGLFEASLTPLAKECHLQTLRRVRGDGPAMSPTLHMAPLATSDLVVNSADLAGIATAADRKVIAFDMEAYAVSRTAAHFGVRRGTLVIRTVGDIVTVSKRRPRRYASRLSLQFAQELIGSFGNDLFGATKQRRPRPRRSGRPRPAAP